jgi:hypothetical protein
MWAGLFVISNDVSSFNILRVHEGPVDQGSCVNLVFGRRKTSSLQLMINSVFHFFLKNLVFLHNVYDASGRGVFINGYMHLHHDDTINIHPDRGLINIHPQC